MWGHQPWFDHEKARVYQEAVAFVAWAHRLLAGLPMRIAAADQLDRASTSIPLNIAEGNGKSTSRDRCKYFDNARGSALEAASCLDVLVARELTTAEVIVAGKQMLRTVVAGLVGLIRSNSDRVWDASAGYAVEPEGE